MKAHQEGNPTASLAEILPFYNKVKQIDKNVIPNAKAKNDKDEIVDYHMYQALCSGVILRVRLLFFLKLKCNLHIDYKNHNNS